MKANVKRSNPTIELTLTEEEFSYMVTCVGAVHFMSDKPNEFNYEKLTEIARHNDLKITHEIMRYATPPKIIKK